MATISMAILACDNSSTEANSSAIDWNEIPQKCEITLGEDKSTLIYNFVFANWSLYDVDIFDGDSVYITETFSGITESDFEFFCNKDREDPAAFNVVCKDMTITLTHKSYGATAAMTVILGKNTCKKLLNGTQTPGQFFEAE
ncbi:MAG: hypothetical protein MJY99_07330 [Fibrobacter sp.]|nr:hypothetical protein [Fibrobacter sp.]MCQ2063134.1 hypothetical protein [Fibrobacter sp.]